MSSRDVGLHHVVASERGDRQQLEREESRLRAHVTKLAHANKSVSRVHQLAAIVSDDAPNRSNVATRKLSPSHTQEHHPGTLISSSTVPSSEALLTPRATLRRLEASSTVCGGSSAAMTPSLAMFASQSAIEFEEDQAAAVVDRSLQQYFAYLRDVPDRSDVEALRREREEIAAQAARTTQLNATLQHEVDAREDYTLRVVHDIAAQERERGDVLHTNLAHAINSRRDEIIRLAREQHAAFDHDREKRLVKVRQSHEFLKQHGNYPHRLEEAKELRRLAEVAQEKVDHLRRGFVKKYQSPMSKVGGEGVEGVLRGSSASTTPPPEQPDNSPQQHTHEPCGAEVEAELIHRFDQNDAARIHFLNSRQSAIKMEHKAHALAVDEANAIRQRRQHEAAARREHAEEQDSKFQSRQVVLRQRKKSEFSQRLQREAALREFASSSLAQRVAEKSAARQAEISAEQKIWLEDAAVLRQAHEASRIVDTVIDATLLDRNVKAFLNRMNMDDAFADDMNILRAKRATENREYWLDRKRAMQERREAAAAKSQAEKLHHALQCRNTSLMAKEAVLVQQAMVRLQMRKIVEQAHQEKMTRLRSDKAYARRKVLEAMYDGSSPLPTQQGQGVDETDEQGYDEAIGNDDDDDESFRVDGDDEECQEEDVTQLRSASGQGQARRRIEDEHAALLRWRRRMPQPCSVLSPNLRRIQPSLSYPTAKNIAACSDQDIAKTATRLLELENEQQKVIRAKQLAEIARDQKQLLRLSSAGRDSQSPHSPGLLNKATTIGGRMGSGVDEANKHLSQVQRADAVERLTKRTVAEEARAHAKLEDAKPRTFHDHLEPVSGCNARLYSADPQSRHRHLLAIEEANNASNNRGEQQPRRQLPVEYWGHHFYEDALKQKELRMHGLEQASLLASIVPASKGNSRTASPVAIDDVVQRLATPTYAARDRSRAQSASLQNKSKMKTRVASARQLVQRLYTKSLAEQKVVAQELDEKYLGQKS